MWTTSYIISQILTLFVYALFCLSYFQNKKKQVLGTNILAHVLQTIAFYLIGGYTGMAMDIILIFRDNFFYKEELMKEEEDIYRKIHSIEVIMKNDFN